MITRAKIIQEVAGSNGYKWVVNIPILYGKPNNEDEQSLFDSYYISQDAVKTNSSSVKKDLLQQYLDRNKNQVTLENSSNNIPYDPEYTTVASVCGIPKTKIHYRTGDVVFVGFENNNMGYPVILGSVLTQDIEEKSSTKIEIDARSLSVDVDQSVVLPLNKTTFARQRTDDNSYNELTMQKIEQVVKFFDKLEELNIKPEDLSELLIAVDMIKQQLVPFTILD